MPPKRDLAGSRFGRLVVQCSTTSNSYGYKWLCLCDCGSLKEVQGINLVSGNVKSCGCLVVETSRKLLTRHGEGTKGKTTPRWRLWSNARRRAKAKGVAFEINLDDIVIPEYCPITGTKLVSHTKKLRGDSPTLDRIVNSKGYIKGNVWVISLRANSWKSDFTLEELKKFTKAVEDRHNSTS